MSADPLREVALRADAVLMETSEGANNFAEVVDVAADLVTAALAAVAVPPAGLPTPPEAEALRAAFIAGAKWADDACPVHAYGQVVVGEAGRRYGDPAAADVAEGGA